MTDRSAQIEAWLAGRLDDAGCVDLLAAVDADPALARRLAEGARMDLLLAAAHGRRPDLRGAVLAGLRSPASRTRLRNAVMRSLPGPRGRIMAGPWRWWLAAAAALVLGLAGLWALRDPVVGRVLHAPAGAVLIRGGAAIPAESGAGLLPGDVVDAGPGGVQLSAGRTRIALSGRLGLRSTDAFSLDAGRLEAQVEPDPTATPVRFTTPQAEAVVVGTAFTLSCADGRTRLEVGHGAVTLAGLTGPPVRVESGRAAAADATRSAELQPLMTPLFPAGLEGWHTHSGSWSWRDGVLIGGEETGNSRLVTYRSYGDFDLEAQVRIHDVRLAEFQILDYAWFVRIPQQEGWMRLQVRVRGQDRVCLLDGRPLAWDSGYAAPAVLAGQIAFYIRSGGRLEVRDARIGVP